ncbi:MAG: histidine kinase, partial [Bacteroidota bacterium]
EAQIKANLAESKLVALKSQMNPHFVFNCINTTQNFVLNSRKEMAYEYLASFAKLLRLILDKSEQIFVSLENEIEQLGLYLKLESTRFEGAFEYEITLDQELESGVFEIPGMIVQPIVENAILHGLVNRKDKGGMLRISFLKKGQTIVCEVEDNGIGRAEAKKIKTSKEVHYQSTAIPNIQRRLELLQESIDVEIQYNTTDLFAEGKSSGTLVKVVLPIG